jgi:chromosome segregation ATPase
VKTTPVQFIPLDLAVSFVRRLEADARRSAIEYRENIKQLKEKYEEMQGEIHRTQTIHTNIQAEVHKGQAEFDRMSADFAAYRSSAQVTLDQLKERIASLSAHNKDLNAALEAERNERETCERDLETERKAREACERDIAGLIVENLVLQTSILDTDTAGPVLALLQQHEAFRRQIQSIRETKGKVQDELHSWTDHFQETLSRIPTKSDFGPVSHLRLQDAAYNDQLQALNQQISPVRKQLRKLGFKLRDEDKYAKLQEERDELLRKLKLWKDNSGDLETMTQERNVLDKELKELKRVLAAPARDDPEIVALRSQFEYVSSELMTCRAKAIALEVECRQLKERTDVEEAPKRKSSFRSEQFSPRQASFLRP